MALTKVSTIGIATGISLTGVTTTQDAKVGTGITLSPDGDGYYTGIVTATSYRGDVSNCTGVGQTNFIDAESLNVSGISTLNSTKVGTGITLSPDGDVYVTGVTTVTTLKVATGTVTGDLDVADKIVHTGDTDTSVRFPGADTIALQTGGTQRIHVASDGKIGINSINPSHSLDVYGTGNQYIKVLKGDTQPVYFGNVNGESVVESTGAFFVKTAGSERARIDTGGRLLMGTASNQHGGGDLLQLAATSSIASVSLNRYTDNAHPSYFNFFKSRNGSISGQTVVQSGDSLGNISFYGSDGTNRALGCEIYAQVDGTPGDGDMPGRFVFKTSADGSEDPTERLRIDSAGAVILSNTFNSNTSISPALCVGSSSFSRPGIVIRGNSTNKGDISFCDNSGTDASTGVSVGLVRYDHDGDYMCFHTNDTEKVRITSDGDVGINCTASCKLQVSDSTGSISATKVLCAEFRRDDGTRNPRLQIQHNEEGTILNHTYSTGAGNLMFAVGGTEVVRWNGSGQFVGTSAEIPAFHYKCTKGAGSNTQGHMLENTQANHSYGTVLRLHINTSGQDRPVMTFTSANASSGDKDWMIGPANGFDDFRINSAGGGTSGSWGTTRFRLEHGGTFHGSGSNDISDQRLKDNVTTISNASTKIKALRGVTYNWQSRTGLDTKTKYGFVAQEMDSVIPDLVCKTNGLFWFNKAGEIVAENNESRDENPDGSSWDIHSSGVIPILVESLKEALAEIETLKTRVAALE